MKKLVNSKIVEIDNIELFELGQEGLAIQSVATSNTSEGIETNLDSPMVQKYIKLYNAFFKYLPYPLYAIEEDIKYATLGQFIKMSVPNTTGIWVNKGLYIKLDDKTGMTLHIINNTWAIKYIKENREDNACLDNYKGQLGYEEYKWVLEKVLAKDQKANFYAHFMPNFIKACNNQQMLIGWELKNILKFCDVPAQTQLRTNSIIDINNDKEYTLDIYCSGTAETNIRETVWNLNDTSNIDESRMKRIKTYDFDAYCKPLADSSRTSDKLRKCELSGLNNLFLQLCNIKTSENLTKFPQFEGVIADGCLAFTVNKKLYITRSNRLMEPVDIAHGATLYAVENGKIYFSKTKEVNEKIDKETIYSYTIANGAIRLCNIRFVY